MAEADPIPDLLQAFEEVLESNKRIALIAAMLIEALRHGRRLPVTTLAEYSEQLENVERDRRRMEDIVAAVWQMIGREEAH